MARSGKIPFWVKFNFGLGQIGEAAFSAITLTFVSLYYNQGLGLNIDLVGWALGLAILSAAISGPIIGAFSDRFRSKWGRRHPFLLISSVPLALSLYFLFSPPEFLRTVEAGSDLPPQAPLFMWMVVWNIMARFFLSVYLVPSVAMAAELSSDYSERASIFSFQSIFGYGFGTSLSYLAWQMLAGTSRRAYDGEIVPRHLDAANYPPLIIIGCCFVVIGIFVRVLGTRKEIPYLDQASDDMPRFSLLEVVRDIFQACQNRNYLFLLFAGVSIMLSGGLGESIGPYLGTYYWEFEGAQLKWFSIAIMVGAMPGAWITPFWIRKFEKRPVCIGMIATYIIVAPIPVLDRLTGLNILTPANHTPQLLPFLLVHAAICYHCMAGLGVCVMSMLADIIDQNTLKTGHAKAAIFYSARGLFSQASRSLAILVGGFVMMHLVKMPVGAVPGKIDVGVINRLGLAFVLRLMGTFISIFFYARYRLSRSEHAEIRAELAEREEIARAD
ncbi:MFS transporter [Candidatus Poribacteria bacterium]